MIYVDNNKASAVGQDNEKRTSQIVGFRISPAMAAELKSEAKKKNIRLNELLAEMWNAYKHSDKDKLRAR